MDFILSKVFGFLNNYKTKIGMIGAIATFIVLVCNQLADGFTMADIEPIMAGFSALMLALGLGHKAIKIEDGLKK